MTSNSDSSAAIVNELLDQASAAGLGTIQTSGAPFVSLVNVARFDRLHVVMLLSGLAQHTRNLRRDDRCSLLITGPIEPGVDALAAQRVSLSGRVDELKRGNDEAERACLLTRHPSAAMYAELGDFAIFRFEISDAHLVAGFGRIQAMRADQL